MFSDITIHELLELRKSKQLTIVDVRSPSEYGEGTIPGSINIPFFDDKERSQVGTIYKQVGVQEAKALGLRIASNKLPSLVEQFAALSGPIALFCWRGGMRSKSTATVLSLMGIHVYRLLGGVRAYRRWVADGLAHWEWEPECIVINGFTGSGKTRILQQLERKGHPVIDLEAMAGHRGSIFGHIGCEPRNQKQFDADLIEKCMQFRDQPYVLIEAESNRVGKATLPSFLVAAKERGRMLFVDMPLEMRVEQIVSEYQPHLHKSACIEAFDRIHKRMHTPIAKEISSALEENRFHDAARLLLVHYYDPRYAHGALKYEHEPVVLCSQNVDEAVQRIEKQVESWFVTI